LVISGIKSAFYVWEKYLNLNKKYKNTLQTIQVATHKKIFFW
jgi:hypothetical protein